VLDRRYPTYQAESVVFNIADPLAASRQAIERAMRPSARRLRLLLTGSGIMAALAAERARQITSEQAPERPSAMILQVHYEATGPKAEIFDFADGIPQSLHFDLKLASESDAMVDYVRAIGPCAIEIIDPAHLPLAVVNGLLKLGVPHDVLIGDGALAADADIRAAATPPLNESTSQAAALTKAALKNDDEPRAAAKRWQEIAVTADRILVPSRPARAFALNHLDQSIRDRVAALPFLEVKPRDVDEAAQFHGSGCCRSVQTARSSV